MGEPKRSELVAAHAPDTILLHCRDYKVRNRSLPKDKRKQPGWLVDAITCPYGLHPDTEREVEREERAARADAARQAEAARNRQEKDEVDAAHRAAVDRFDTMDRDERLAWGDKVCREYPPALVKGMHGKDPGDHPKLKLLVLGLIAAAT